jgi:DNA replication protein DnaC
MFKTQSCLRATSVTVGHLGYHGTVCRTGESRDRCVHLPLDELGYLPIDKHGADLLFQIVTARYEVVSNVITTNRSFREWGKLFNADNTLEAALIDRLMHHGREPLFKETAIA